MKWAEVGWSGFYFGKMGWDWLKWVELFSKNIFVFKTFFSKNTFFKIFFENFFSNFFWNFFLENFHKIANDYSRFTWMFFLMDKKRPLKNFRSCIGTYKFQRTYRWLPFGLIMGENLIKMGLLSIVTRIIFHTTSQQLEHNIKMGWWKEKVGHWKTRLEPWSMKWPSKVIVD